MDSDNKPKALYVVLPNNHSEWEDHCIFLSIEEAQEELDKLNRTRTESWRIEVFKIQNRNSYTRIGYTPTYEKI